MNLTDIINKGRQDFRTIGQETLPYVLAGAIALGGMSCGKKKSTSPPTTQPKTEAKAGVTNSKGQAYFTDNSTLEEVVLEVVDKHDKSPIKDINVAYCDGDGYEVFLINDPSNEYFPSIGIYPHNSTHIIETRKIDGGIYEIYTINEDDELAKVVRKWKADYYERTWKYEKTIDYEERLEIQDKKAAIVDIIWKDLEFFGAVPTIPFFTPSKGTKFLFPEEENPPQRWDIYTTETKFILPTGTFPPVMIPSNIPTVSIEDLDINDEEVSVSWEGTDKDTYEEKFYPDLTKYVDGNSTSDLTYSYRIIKNQNVYNGFDWTAYNSKTSATINIPEHGNYTLELRVKDEVDNIGETAGDFLIKGGELPTGKIVFESARDGNDELYVMNPDGTEQKNLTNHPDYDCRPSWSLDGTKIAFDSTRDRCWEIYVMNADGSDVRRLTNNPTYFNRFSAWSPDANKIAFASDRDGNFEIYVMNSDGSNQKNLTNHPARDLYPNWSPKGNKIAFMSKRDGNKEIYVMNSDGTNQIRLTKNSYPDSSPTWSPDGKRIAFRSSRGRNSDIYVMNPDGTNQRNLTNNPFVNWYPSWSPDGNWIAFESYRYGNWDIYVMNADGTEQTRLTDDPAEDLNPDWGP